MNEDRDAKIVARIKELASVELERESNKSALITLTRVELYDRGRSAMLYISVLPESAENSALNFVKRKRPELRDAIKKGLNVRTVPFIDVAIDTGEKARNNIDALLRQE